MVVAEIQVRLLNNPMPVQYLILYQLPHRWYDIKYMQSVEA